MTKARRIGMIDSLRGFAVLGMLVANMLFFQYGTNNDVIISTASMVDKMSYYLIKIFVEGTFYPIFIFLFGFSLVKLDYSLKKSRWVIIRRAIGLLFIGFIHLIFISESDVLVAYSATVLFCILFLKREAETCFTWAAIISVFIVVTLFYSHVLLDTPTQQSPLTEEKTAIYATGSYMDIVENRIANFTEASELFNPISLIIITFIVLLLFSPIMLGPFMLIGMGIAKKGQFSNPDKEKKLYRQWAYLLPIGIALKSLIFLEGSIGELGFMIGTYVLSAGYIGAFALLYHSSFGEKLAALFNNVGYMSLTNYLVQSIICTTLFYGYGFGLFGRLGITVGILLSFVIFALQVVFSNWFLSKYNHGPFEYVLRIWTYLKTPQKTETVQEEPNQG